MEGRTHLFELATQIHENTDLKILSVCYTADSLEVIFQDYYDRTKYHIIMKPTDKEKL